MRDLGNEAGRRPHIFSAEGEAALAQLLSQRALLAFDFDGTLAPIVAQPAQARLSQAVAARLAALTTRLPVAVISGRSLADLRQRLGFAPTYLVGNHGAEHADEPEVAQAWRAALDPLRAHLQGRQERLLAVGVGIEDKGLSLALHHRLAASEGAALAAIEEALQGRPPGIDVFAGKRVVNVVASGCPDKADAMFALVARTGAETALFAGDDVNDEPVFERAPAHWLTLRVGRDAASRARFYLDSPTEMAMLLERLRQRLERQPR
ncbi:MAG: trehalose-phosphatase [Rubrivivax sp. SCN 71-131]|jgi:trehalose 6-phosphate phosphatase|nr:MAG: trehalose-phosphatase [Rubrivivax sp. SCN 71-131]